MATVSYRRNLIAQVQDDHGASLILYEDKANHFWCSFKNRMGITENATMGFDLNVLVPSYTELLSTLTSPFSTSEIDHLIHIMPADKAPRPDGFNGVFIKKCWPIIKEDMYRLFKEFYDNNVSLSPINNSFIVLVPKINNPNTSSDFRPISLLNCRVKLLTKLLAVRLQGIVLKIIHMNHYGFIKHRTIQDCVAWSFEYIHQCHHSRREIVIVKLDFAKAFDTIEHSTIISMLQVLGFPSKWIQWV